MTCLAWYLIAFLLQVMAIAPSEVFRPETPVKEKNDLTDADGKMMAPETPVKSGKEEPGIPYDWVRI